MRDEEEHSMVLLLCTGNSVAFVNKMGLDSVRTSSQLYLHIGIYIYMYIPLYKLYE